MPCYFRFSAALSSKSVAVLLGPRVASPLTAASVTFALKPFCGSGVLVCPSSLPICGPNLPAVAGPALYSKGDLDRRLLRYLSAPRLLGRSHPSSGRLEDEKQCVRMLIGVSPEVSKSFVKAALKLGSFWKSDNASFR